MGLEVWWYDIVSSDIIEIMKLIYIIESRAFTKNHRLATAKLKFLANTLNSSMNITFMHLSYQMR
jgi:hypothetical protein